MQSPEVSVVLPAYNARESIAGALQSLSVQDHDDFEIVVADDGSTDDTADIVAKAAAHDPRIRPLFLPHKGVAEAFNSAMAAARGRFVARVDADDLCLPSRLQRQAAFLREHPEVGLVACRVEFGGDRKASAGYAHHVDWTNSLLTHEDMSLGRFVDAPFANPSAMFRHELVELHGGALSGDFPEDYEMWLRWLEAGVRMEKLPEALYVWNDPPTRATRTDPRYDPMAFYRVKARYLARWLERHNSLCPDIVVIGSGRTTRKRCDLLEEHGVRIRAYVDIDPRKIGTVIRGIPVIHRDEIPGPEACFAVHYVASRGAREEVAAFLESRGFKLGQHWIAAA